jgi:enoyl-CoA hydratase
MDPLTTDPTTSDERPPVVIVQVEDRVATITLNRPEARNALDSEVLRLLPAALSAADARDDVDVIVLTGADPAFCAGLDLRQLGSDARNLRSDGTPSDRPRRGPFPPLHAPVIGAVNGAAVTGGFELALACDFLIASEHARFGDTHARVGVMPGWGLTVHLPRAIGVRRAREMSFTGNFIDADEAYRLGLVNHVVAHDELLPFTLRLARDIAANDREGVRQIRQTYADITADEEAWDIERRHARAWQQAKFDPAVVERRREAIIERGRSQR